MTRHDSVREMVERGFSNSEIASALGLKSDRQVIRLKHQAGVPVKSYVIPSPDQIAEIQRLSREEQWPPEEIAATLGVSWHVAHTYSDRGPGRDWSDIAGRLAYKHPRLWRELRGVA